MRFRKELVRFENWDEDIAGSNNGYVLVGASDNSDTAVPQANPEQAAADAKALGIDSTRSLGNEDFLSESDNQPF